MQGKSSRAAILAAAVGLALLGGAAGSARAQTHVGYQLNKYEPSVVGDPFLYVEHPWYSSMRYFALGLTYDYGRNLLVVGTRDMRTQYIIEHQHQAHLELAGSFLDRIGVSASIPFNLKEIGTLVEGRDVNPNTGVHVGDLRFGLRIRIAGQPEEGPASLSFSGNIWVPIPGARAHHVGDDGVRATGKVLFGGVVAEHLRYSLNFGYHYRPTAQVSDNFGGVGNTIGRELQGGLGLQGTFLNKSLSFGPEVLVAIPVFAQPAGQTAVQLEALGTISYLIMNQVMVQASAGGSIYGSPSPPDFRFLARLAYAPRRKAEQKPPPPPADRDEDGIPDASDACPDVPGVASDVPAKNGCPPPSDRDRDGVLDESDACPDVAQGEHPDPKQPGCPAKDTDSDSRFDYEDECPTEPMGAKPDPKRLGCPALDSDGDGLVDHEDQCPNEPIGLIADPDRPGCPAPDKDKDNIMDKVDACPDKPGAPDPDPKKNGCPGLVLIKDNQIIILQQVFFDTNKDTIKKKSFPLLDAVVYTLKANTIIKKCAVEGHTDNKGKPDKNMDLSNRRAKSVMKYLTDHGIEGARLESHGYGDTKPIADNKTTKGRDQNRRVVFRIVDPAPRRSAARQEVTPSPPDPALALADPRERGRVTRHTRTATMPARPPVTVEYGAPVQPACSEATRIPAASMRRASSVIEYMRKEACLLPAPCGPA